jgi:hypothetical protein
MSIIRIETKSRFVVSSVHCKPRREVAGIEGREFLKGNFATDPRDSIKASLTTEKEIFPVVTREAWII